MAIARVGTGSGVKSTTSGAALTWTHSPTANNLLTFRVISWANAGGASAEVGATAVTTTGGSGTFSRDIALGDPNSGTQRTEWAHVFSLIAPSGVTSMTSAANPTLQMGVFDEWSGNATSSVLDKTASDSSSTNTTSADAGTLSTGANAGLCLAVDNSDWNATTAPTPTGTGWTGDVNQGDPPITGALAYKIISSGSQQMTWTIASSSYAAVSASYNAAAGAAGPVARLVMVPQAVRRASVI